MLIDVSFGCGSGNLVLLRVDHSFFFGFFFTCRMLQPSQLDALFVRKQESRLWPVTLQFCGIHINLFLLEFCDYLNLLPMCLFQLGPDSMEHDLQSLKQKPECLSHDISRKGSYCSDVRKFLF